MAKPKPLPRRKRAGMRKGDPIPPPFQGAALAIASYVRNEMEDFHCEHLSDEQMAQLNPIIRNAIGTAIYALTKYSENETCQSLIDHARRFVPHYWESAIFCENVYPGASEDQSIEIKNAAIVARLKEDSYG